VFEGGEGGSNLSEGQLVSSPASALRSAWAQEHKGEGSSSRPGSVYDHNLAGQPPPSVQATPHLGGRCNSYRQLEGSGNENGEPCPAGLFSDGTALFLHNLKACGRASSGSSSSSSGSLQGGSSTESSYSFGYGGLMPEARSWADMWYSMFAGGSTTQQLDPLFGAAAPLNGFQPYRSGCVSVAGHPLPPTAASKDSQRRCMQAQRQMLPVLHHVPARQKPVHQTATTITRFGTTQYGTITPALDSTKVRACKNQMA